jgi:hypothetical protein
VINAGFGSLNSDRYTEEAPANEPAFLCARVAGGDGRPERGCEPRMKQFAVTNRPFCAVF